MRWWSAVLLVPSLAFAAPRFTTQVAVELADDNAALQAAVTAAIRPSKLDACWRKPARTRARLVIEAGKVTTLELVENGDAKAAACLKRALKAVKLATTDHVEATIVLDGTTRMPPQRLQVLARIDDPSGAASKVFAPADADNGALSSDQINRTIRSRVTEFRACFQNELARVPNLAGKVTVQFTINPDGTVKKASINAASTTLPSRAAQNCIRSNVLRLKFPASTGMAEVSYPFVFTSA